jgi:MYXO-CTERM domain-containing protein
MLPLLLPTAMAAETSLVFDGGVPVSPEDHFRIPVHVPEGTVEIEVRHDDLSDANILDWGLEDPGGFRGWGGGNSEAAVVGVDAASRSYVAGPIAAGTWFVVVGKAKIVEEPARYHVEVVLRDVATLTPQPERAPYEPAILSSEARWYAGDFHVHSRESGDARPPLDEIAEFGRGRGLDFVEISDHNTNTQLDFFADAQARHPDLLFVPGVEFTTYDGHANGVGATGWVDHKIGLDGVTIEGAADAFHDQGAIFSINHPTIDLGNACIGCAWAHPLDGSRIDAVEIGTGGWSQSGWLFSEGAIAMWDALCDEGHHVAAIGGSDDHRAGVDIGAFGSPIGDPTTLVWAEELSTEGILQGIRDGRTVVKLQGPADPMVTVDAAGRQGDTVSGATTLVFTVTGGDGQVLRIVHDGEEADRIVVSGDPFVHELAVDAPAEGEERWRAEIWVAENPRTVTSHVWIAPAASADGDDVARGGCGCASGSVGPWWPALLALGFLKRRN